MYVDNGCKFGFYVTKNSWSNEKYAMVFGIDGVEEGKMIKGKPPYFIRKYPKGHPKAGNIWPRIVFLKPSWLDRKILEDGNGGTYAWSRVYPGIMQEKDNR